MTFILDTDVLDPGITFAFAEHIIEDRGRAITISWSQTGLAQDLEILGYSVRFWPAEEQPQNPKE